ncbi:MAG: hypothetical protein JWP26_44 [Devosia sp.]|uniref:hypothetical protein n=1 Tax=Devosia sp. TaxID=1871048 RepID=UPI00262E534C|nr:hypothetical protein [Devosia sp.]MDB5585074.1 hypothetical protein [Devosia sp.]
MVPKWAFPVFVGALVLAGIFSFSGEVVGQFAGNLFWEMAGIGATIFGVDRLIEHQRLQRERPLRYLALNKLLQVDARINKFWREMLHGASRGEFADDVFSITAAQTISTLQIHTTAPVAPPGPWTGSLSFSRREILNMIAEIYDRGLQYYCSPDLAKALDQLEASNLFKHIGVFDQAKAAGYSLNFSDFQWGRGDGGAEFLERYEKFRNLLASEVQEHIVGDTDEHLATALRCSQDAVSSKLTGLR